jgi:amino acid transporter
LEQFGYRQQLARSMGAFSSFAVSFSLISIITGIFANFGHGLRHAGPAVIWSWVVVVIGQTLIALVVAELAARFPLSGYGYQWASRLVGPQFGFFVGWMLLAQWVTGFPGICKTLAEQLHGMIGLYWQQAPPVSWITVAIISVIAVIHLWGIRLAALVNDAGVIAEIIGAGALTLVLLAVYLVSGDQPLSFLANSTNHWTGAAASPQAFALSLLLGAWCITGFEGAADLAEETHRPRQTVPRAVIASVLGSGVGGFLMLAVFVLSVPSLSAAQASEHPLLEVIHARLGDRAMPAFLALIVVSIFACGLASMAATSRMIFALARDNMLPHSSWLSAVDSVHRAPRNAIFFVWCLSALVVLLLERFDSLNVITSVATVAGYLGYGGIAFSALVGLRDAEAIEGFELRRWRAPVAVAGIAWTMFIVVALTMPSDAAEFRYAPLLATSVAIAAGGTLFLLVVRPRLQRGEAGPPQTADDKGSVNPAPAGQ